MAEDRSPPAFNVGDRVRFTYPNEATGTGTIIECDPDPKNKPYKIRLDAPWRAYREGRWAEYSVVYADLGQIERVAG